MHILAALFFEDLDLNSTPEGPTKINLGGIHFSMTAPSSSSIAVAPHLIVMIHCPNDHKNSVALEVVFEFNGEQLARNVQPVQIEPGRFGYRLVRAQLELETYGTITAHCRVDQGPITSVPFTVLPPVSE